MLFAGNAIFTTIGIGTMIVVFAAVVGSLTVLPALLHRLGDKVDKGRIPFFGRTPRRGAVLGPSSAPSSAAPSLSLALAGGRSRALRAADA